MSPALILLAAGGSVRMGRAKQLLPYRGTTLLGHAVNTALASRCGPIVVVVGAQETEMRGALCGAAVRIVSNPDWAKGMGSSIRAGLTALLAEASPTCVLIMLCDQPAVTSGVLDRLIEQFEREGHPIVASAYDDAIGVPALFDQTLFDELLHLDDSAGASQLIQRHRERTGQIGFAAGAVDVDTPEEYERLK